MTTSSRWAGPPPTRGPPGRHAPGRRAELARFRAELARGTGNNLNQIAHALNADQEAGKLPDAAAHALSLAAAADVALARRAVEQMLPRLERVTGAGN